MHRRRPQLKNGVDLQLQTAFFDGNWPTAIRLADKRSKALKDQYYEVNQYTRLLVIIGLFFCVVSFFHVLNVPRIGSQSRLRRPA